MTKRTGIVKTLLGILLGLAVSASARAQTPPPPPSDAGAPSTAGDAASAPPPASSPSAGEGGDAGATVEAAPVAAPPEPAAGQEMVVTGSRIKQTSSFSAAAPVQVMDRKELEQTGASNVADVVTYLTVSQGSGFQGAGSQSFGTVSVNLRGLGEGATLVLLNGRRLPLSAAYNPKGQQFSDLSIIPLAAIERVEILKGGASAIYGTDAVAGVINVITRKNFDGARIELDGLTTTRLDQRDGTASVALGASSERGRVFVAGSYFARSELVANQRDWTKDGYVNPEGYPGTFLVGARTVPDPACTSVSTSVLIQGAAGPICAFQYRNFVSLSPEVERANVFGSGEYDLTKHSTLFGEILASQLHGGYISSPAFPVTPPFLTVPANHVDNPFGQPVQALISPVGAEYGATHATTDDNTMRAVLGIKGDLEGAAAGTPFESWTWETFGSLASDQSRFVLPDTLRGVIQNALNSCSSPADLAGCYNPFYSAVTGSGTPNSTAVINSFYGAQQSVTESMMQTLNAGVSGSLFELPGGDLGVALGGEIRHESRTTTLDHDAHQDAYSFLIGNTDAKAERNVYGGYGELVWPLFHGVKLQTAGRVEHYTDIQKAAFSPSAGLTITPAEIAGRDHVPAALRKLQLRGNVTSAFRAPNLYQSFPGYVVQPSPLNVGQPVPWYLPVQGFGNPDLKPEHALAVSGGLSWEPIRELNLSTDIWDYDYQDRIELQNAQQIVNTFLQNGSDPRVTVDPTSGQIARVMTKYINIPGDVVTNGIDFAGFITLTNRTFDSTALEDRSQKVTVGAVGTYLMTFNYPVSEAAPRSIPNSTVVLPPAPCNGTGPTATCSAAGQRNFNNVWQAMPRWKVNIPLSWSYLGHSASVIAHYIGSYKDDVNPRPDGSFDTISAWMTFDLQYGYTFKNWIGKELTARVGVYNLLDSDPPHVNGQTTSYDYTLHDPRGRMAYAKLIAQF
ncbi:MAG TPA: TonB-dependent receptor [Polyangiaceae bacterium]|nr:TonB-dependent receptor [Polyangiaceae bacterium]